MKLNMQQLKQLIRETVNDSSDNRIARVLFGSPATRLPSTRIGKKTYKQLFDKEDAVLDDGGFEDMEAFFKAVHSQRGDTRLKTLSSGGTSGEGYLIPEQFAAELLDHSIEDEIVRPRARVWPITKGNTLKVPGFKIGDHSSNLFGGLVAYWGDEEEDKDKGAEPQFRMIELKAKKLFCYTKSSDELVADSGIPFSEIVGEAFTQGIGFYQDLAYLTGTGAGQPLGILNSPALIQVTKEIGQTAATIVWENIINMWAQLWPPAHKRAVWVASISTIPQLFTLQQPVGTGGSTYFPALRDAGGEITLLGKPVLFTEKLPILGSAMDLLLADFSQYSIGLRQQVRIESSNAPNWSKDIRDWRAVLRADGQPAWDEVLTLLDGTTTVSPFVCIEERA